MSKKHKRNSHDEDHVDESWLIPYADLLTLLLALFIVLYSMNSVDVKKFEEMSEAFSIIFSSGGGLLNDPAINKTPKRTGSGDNNPGLPDKTKNKDKVQKDAEGNEPTMEEIIAAEKKEFNALKEQLDDYIAVNGLNTQLETHLNQSQLVITISEKALFDPARADVKPEAVDIAVAIGSMLEQYPDYSVIIAGHTDTVPINNAEFKSNWDLSVIRAVRFQDILLQNKDLDPKRFSPVGYGEYWPVADNDTVEGKAKNRRVEISIVHTYADTSNNQQISAQQQQAASE